MSNHSLESKKDTHELEHRGVLDADVAGHESAGMAGLFRNPKM